MTTSTRILSIATAATLALAPAAGATKPVPKMKTPPATKPAPKAKTPSAAALCKSERVQMGPKTFKEVYGTGKTHANAFGKCVAGKTKHATVDQSTATVNAARTCKAARTADRAAFAAKWGTKPGALGTCVSTTAKA